MKIFMVVHQFPPERFGGAERHASQLAGALSKKHDVFIYTQSVRGDGVLPEESSDGFRVRRWNDRRIAAQPALAADFLSTASAFSPDIVHLHHGIGYPPKALAALASRYPSVATLHDYWWICARIRLLFKGETPCDGPANAKCAKCFHGAAAKALAGEAAAFLESGPLAPLVRSWRSSMPGTRESAETGARKFFVDALERSSLLRRFIFLRRWSMSRRILDSAKILISPSRYLVQRYREAGLKFIEKKIRFVPYGIDPSESQKPADRAPVRPVRFALVGHMNAEKGLSLALRAFRDIPPRDASLDIYGDVDARGSDAQLPELSSVRFHGPFLPKQSPEIWSKIDVLVVPSIWAENAPKVIHEAFAARVPVIAPDHGAFPEFVGEGNGGWLFTAQDALSLENLVCRLSGNPKEILDAGRTLPASVTIADSSREIESIYSDAIRGLRGR